MKGGKIKSTTWAVELGRRRPLSDSEKEVTLKREEKD
jgi:hypothetical protein